MFRQRLARLGLENSSQYFRFLSRSLQTTARRRDGGKPRLYKELSSPAPPPQDHRRAWFFKVYRITNIAIIPFAAFYCVFVADFGDHEHVFSPARRWLDHQRREFYSLSSDELELARAGSKDSPTNSAPSPDT
ncbi:hypothetical protein BDY19DRAFT_349138 [Irpex rosettiformis]|uniref:Uncharacterized protein n=1 Tax=Irpex rosettiformis TaxID=378272 RepID=A0ACB8TX54_9APHY|nr:hypothetical protein BDY19DRAFT_349138 [Irpex rosettiformis]